MAEALKTNKTLEEMHVGNVMVGCKVRLKSSGEECAVTTVHNSGNINITKPDGSSQQRVKPSEFDAIPAVLPAKQLRENTIETLNLSNKGLGVDGGLMLAALMAGNNSTRVLDVSSNGLAQAFNDELTKHKPQQLTLKM